MTVIGLDVGYSNLKIAVGEAGGSRGGSTPSAGAAPVDRLRERVGLVVADAILVDVDGQRWAAAIEAAASRAGSAPARGLCRTPPTGRW